MRGGTEAVNLQLQPRTPWAHLVRIMPSPSDGPLTRFIREMHGRAPWQWPSWLDFKLGFRMLVKYPGLTFVGGLAISFAIAVGAVMFVAVTELVLVTLPFDEGDRIVRVLVRNAETGLDGQNPSLHDFVMWREEFQSVDDLAAFRQVIRSVAIDESRTEASRGAEMTASAFRAARVPPLLGRLFDEGDERVGAPGVVLIGWDMWQTRLGGDPDVVGRTVRLGTDEATVIGVMPERFGGFPENEVFWAPLRLDVLEYERSQSPLIAVFGRLAPGASHEEAQAELSTLGARSATAFPDTHEHLRPQVGAFAGIASQGWLAMGMYSLNATFFTALLLLICANVSLFVFARTAARDNEIAVRNALGASRARIVMQLFAEALVLGGLAATIGLVVADFGMGRALGVLDSVTGGGLPFWVRGDVTPAATLYAGVFTVFGAVVVGVVPALKLTGDLQPRLQGASRHGPARRMGGLWTTVVVVQSAVTVIIVTLGLVGGQFTRSWRSFDAGFPAAEYLTVSLTRDRGTLPGSSVELPLEEFSERFVAAREELERRIEAEPGVLGVSAASQLPGGSHPRGWIEIEGEGEAGPAPSATGRRAQMVWVAQDLFDLVGKPMLAGRGFDSGDFDPDAHLAIVNESFVRTHLNDRNAIGRRVRYLNPGSRTVLPSPDQEPGPWHEIVGVVSEIGLSSSPDVPPEGIYHPLTPEASYPLRMAVHLGTAPEAFAPTLHALASDVDPALRVSDVRTMDEPGPDLLMYEVMFGVFLSFGALSLLLANAAIYSVVSFTVERRTREIGVRVALGANRRRIVGAILGRPLVRLGVGAGLGGLLLTGLLAGGGGLGLEDVTFLTAFVAVMCVVCFLACIVPIRRALRIEPTEALRAEG